MIKDLKNSDYLKLGENYFKLKENKSSLSIEYNDKNFISINIDISFEEGEYNDLDVSPHIEINNIKTSANKLDDLKGILFEINDVNESYDRGDSFYLHESEPFVKYKIEILEVDEQNAHIKLNGIGITDGYSKPYKTENFTVDAIVPIKIYNNDSNKIKQQETNHLKKNNKIKKDKFKSLVGITLFGLMSGLMSIILLMNFTKEHNIVYLFVSILMLLGSLLCLYTPFYEIFNSRKKYLKRSDLINYFENTKILKTKEVRIAHVLSFLSFIKKTLNNYSYKKDSRFVTYGRLDFLEKEMYELLEKDDVFRALINLEEYVRGTSHMFQPNQVPQNENYHNLLKNYDDYYKDGIICEEEKNKIIELINKTEDFINKNTLK